MTKPDHIPTDVPLLPEALEQWRGHSIRYVAWVLFHAGESRELEAQPEEYHEEVRALGKGIALWDGVGSIKDHLVEYAPNMAGQLADVMDQAPITTGGRELLAAMRRACAVVELRHALDAGNLGLINTAQAHFEAASKNQADPWATARKVFPRKPVPWEHFSLAESIKQLARSGAVTPNPLPGAVFAIVAGLIGRAADVSAKPRWKEPLILWHADIRESGDGKTHPARTLLQPTYVWQEEEEERARREKQTYEALTKKEKQKAEIPKQARSYFGTDHTIEGIQSNLNGHPTGGIIILLDELSSFFSGQNQYKNGKGSDREAWLCLHDGQPARIIRAGGSCYVSGGRVQLYGGIQPAVLKHALSANDGIFLNDGTVFRFLFTSSRSSFRELTGESWDDSFYNQWKQLLTNIRAWTEQHTEDVWHMALNQEAREYFYNWRNGLFGLRDSLPGELRGFIPKAVGYALRLTGIIHCMNRLVENEEPFALLKVEDIQAGIAFVEFYMGQTVDAIGHLVGRTYAGHKFDRTDQRITSLARVLFTLEDEAEGGRIPVGRIQELFNSQVPDNEGFRSSRAMGSFLRSLGLTVPGSRHNWKDKRGVYCLVLDENAKALEKICQQPPFPGRPSFQNPHG